MSDDLNMRGPLFRLHKEFRNVLLIVKNLFLLKFLFAAGWKTFRDHLPKETIYVSAQPPS